jgi:hypothetical protein
MPAGSASISFNILAPVVVYPDIVSKKAEAKEEIVPLNINGNDPVIPSIIHPKVTIRYPSLLVNSFLLLLVKYQINIPRLALMAEDISMALKSGEP